MTYYLYKDNTFLLIHNTLVKNNLFFFLKVLLSYTGELYRDITVLLLLPDKFNRDGPGKLFTSAAQVIHGHKKKVDLSTNLLYQTQNMNTNNL